MKPLKFSGACVAIAVLFAMAVAASAHANARPSTAPAVSTIVAPPSLNPITSAEVAAVARLGISLPRAREAIAVQSAVERADLVNKLEAALGDAYGGVWYVPAAAQLDVGVTSAASARIAEAVAVRAGLGLYVTEILVHSSEAELAAVQKELSRRLSDLFAREEVVTRASVEDNTVYVELGSEVPAGERTALEVEASKAPVKVVVTGASRPKLQAMPAAQCEAFKEEEAYCDPTIVAGTSLEGEVERCTTGPAVLSSSEPTETYVLTAGHCVVNGAGEIFSSFNKAGKKKEVGAVAAFVSPNNGENADVAAIKVKNSTFWTQAGDIPVVPAIAELKEKKETEPFKVKGETAPVEKAVTCGSGQTTGSIKCGTIKKIKVEVPPLKELVEVEGTEVNLGDSGGPWFSGEGLVQGTLYGTWELNNHPLFEPLQWSFKRLKELTGLEVKLLTEANQTRLHEGATAFTCVKGTGAAEPFKDAHCDEKVSTKEGYKHEEIKPGTKTLIDLTNAKTSHETQVTTPGILRGTIGGVTFEVQCTNFTGKGTIENKEIEKKMQNEGTKGSGEFTSCTVIRPENSAEERHPCKVKEPITLSGSSITKENLGTSGKEMGVEFKPEAGQPLAKFTFEGVNCSLKEKTVEVTGTAIATGNTGSNGVTTNGGATLKFTTAMTSETLKVGTSVAEFSAVFTPSMYNEATKVTENPIALTTTNP